MQIHWSLAGVGMTVFKISIRMRKVEIGDKLKKLLNQRLRIHPSHQKYFFRFLEARGPIFWKPGIGQFGGFRWILRISTILVNFFEKLRARSQPGWNPGGFY